MLKRYPMSYRSQLGNSMASYVAQPLFRKPVAPGERISSLILQTRMMSRVMELLQFPMLVQAWAFYCPYRLVWPEWIDFIALDGVVTAPPVSSVSWPQGYDGLTAPTGGSITSWNALFRRMYKLTYNQYFGQEDNPAGTSWYANINDDALDLKVPGNLGRLLEWNQWQSASRRAAYSETVFQAAVSGANAAIPLDQFARAMANNRDRRHQKLTGDKYVDTMRAMGVELDWRVQMAPEFLGTMQQVVMPSEKQSTNPGENSEGFIPRASEVKATLRFELKRPVAFSEHGEIFVLFGVRFPIFRPIAHDASQMLTQSAFYRPEREQLMQTLATSTHTERYIQYLKGHNLMGDNRGIPVWGPGSVNTNYYPGSVPLSLMSLEEEPSEWMFSTVSDVVVKGMTTVPPNRF